MVLVILSIVILLMPDSADYPAPPTSLSTAPETAVSSLPPESASQEEAFFEVPDLTVAEGPTFSCAAEDFILYCNRNTDWLSPLEEWLHYPGEAAPCTAVSGDRYTFDPDPAIHNEPSVSLYIHEGRISQVSLTLAEHDWTQWRHDMFLTQCRNTLDVFFPDLTEQEIGALASRLYAQAAEAGQSAGNCTVWYKNTAGCCGYFENGIIFVCVVPVPENSAEGRYVPIEEIL
jgi:hypothetical protein